jgi:hypothetical protein
VSLLDRAVFTAARALLLRMYRGYRLHLVGMALTGLFPARDVQRVLYPDLTRDKLGDLYGTLDDIRARFGHSSVIAGRSINLMNRLERDSYGYILRTPSLTK